MSAAEANALKWLQQHNADGVFDRHNVLMAAGERAPFMYATWQALCKQGLAQRYGQNNRRIALTEQGKAEAQND